MRIAVLVVLACTAMAPSPLDARAMDTPAVADSVDRTAFFYGGRGVVWDMPEAARAAEFTLEDIAEAGVTVVRVPAERWLAPDGDRHAARVLARAESLDISVAADLPLAYRSADQVSAAADTLGPTLDRLASIARRHEALVAIGLGRALDTASPDMCPVLTALASETEGRMPSLSRYYVTPFRAASDRCASSVDGVLLDVRGLEDPLKRWRRWTERSTAPVAIAAAGAWVDPEATSGLSVPHSVERQARAIESMLTGWIPASVDPLLAAPMQRAGPGGTAEGERAGPTVFVFRWADTESPLGRRYGLRTVSGESRPAASVVRGIYSGEQRVFAFPSGEAPGAEAPWAVLFGWFILIGMGALYARRPLFRRALGRYFMAHGFYRDSVCEGRDTVPLVNWICLLAVGIATGVVAAVIMEVLAPSMIAERLVEALNAGLDHRVGTVITAPVTTGALTAGLVVALLLVWSIVIGLTVRSWAVLRSDQVLMLVAWPCWPALVWMGVALVTISTETAGNPEAAGLLAAFSVLTAILSTVRVLRDVKAVTQMPAAVATLLALFSPAAVIAALLAVGWAQADLPLDLLIHLMGQT
ncbi:hypothetical protein [Longibacter sp.]|uniref:hypothetical protein n=1 Tax=Longibacter sp. TaxID=2045415 RepID=UPI003EBD9584